MSGRSRCTFVSAAVAAALASAAPSLQAQQSVESGQADLEEITVTGSRIARVGGYEAPTPVTVVDAEQLARAAPSNIADGLNQLPQFSNSSSQRAGDQLGTDAPQAGNYLDLRGVGSIRTLVLLDGRRVPPTSPTGTVDVNTLPQLLVERVDVVTAGASAVYGSDAITGVVNYVLDDDFTGVKGVAQGGRSNYSDADSWRVGLAGGTPLLDGRMHVLFSVEKSEDDGIPSKADRPEWGPLPMVVGAGTAANPYVAITNARMRSSTFGGLIRTGPLANWHFLPSGEAVPMDPGQPTASAPFAIGGDGSYWEPSTLNGTLDTQGFFGRMSFDFTDSLTGFIQASYGESTNSYRGHTLFSFGNSLTIFSGNAFLPQAVQDVLDATGTPSFRMNRMHRDFGFAESTTDNETLNATLGLRGKLGGSWQWNAYYTRGDAEMHTKARDYLNVNLAAALDAVVDPATGSTVCRVTLTHPGQYPGCEPINIFGEGAPSQAALNYIIGVADYKVENVLDEVGFDIGGDVFEGWAGPISVVVGATYREQTIEQVSNSDPSQPVDTTGIRGAFSDLRTSVANVGTADGGYDVTEIFAETVVPLVTDGPLGDRLELNGAVRYADYSTSGGDETWKIGLNYQPFEDLRFRITRSRDMRAPTHSELFAGRQVGVSGIFDPLTGINDLTLETGGGNVTLEPEIGNTLTYGVGYQPSWVPGLTLSVDYYDVEITGAIAGVGTQTALDVCFASGGTDPVCALITRPISPTDPSPANFPTEISTAPLNIASLETKGIDIEASYQRPVGPGTLGLRLIANYLDSFERNNGVGAPTIEYVGVVGQGSGYVDSRGKGLPKWRGALSATWSAGPLTLFVQQRYIHSMTRAGGNLEGLVYADNLAHVGSVSYTDFTVEYGLPSLRADLFLSITNAFDKRPPTIGPENYNPGVLYPTARAVYDIVGRYYTAGLRVKF